MCIPSNIVSGGLALTKSIASNVIGLDQSAKENNYRTQIAINNANLANAQALRQKQMGIEKARQEKIQGLSQMHLQQAKNASSGFDISSQSNLYNYEDILNTANQNAATTKSQYDSTAQDYFSKAKDYLAQTKTYKQDLINDAFSSAMRLKDDFSEVSSVWSKDIE